MTTPIVRLAAAGLCTSLLAACAQAPAPRAPARSPEPAGTEAPDPRLRGVRPADVPREEPGVGVGGLTHEAPQPVR